MDRAALAGFVRPRVLGRGAGEESRLLEELLEERATRGEPGTLFLLGPEGSGKHTALEYVRRRFAGDERIVANGGGSPDEQVVRVSIASPLAEEWIPAAARLALAPWACDEWIEYLLARHPAACKSVMARLERPVEHLDLPGLPALWAALLDRMAAEPGLRDSFQALRAVLRSSYRDEETFARACRAFAPARQGTSERREGPPALLHIAGVKLLLAAEGLLQELLRPEPEPPLPRALSQDLLACARPLLLDQPRVRQRLAQRFEVETGPQQASAAALLHQYGPEALAECLRARIPEGAPPCLNGAELGGLVAPGVTLARARMEGTRLVGARLAGADLREAVLSQADLSGAELRGASLVEAVAAGACLRGADLRAAQLVGARMESAQLDACDLEHATLLLANLRAASLRGARLDHADLRRALLAQADLEGAVLHETDLSWAVLDDVDLRSLATRKLKAARLPGANLEGVELDAPDLSGADLTSAHLTGARFPRANLRGAILVRAGLAQIDLEGADLVRADLTHASFHLGSSRSGLLSGAPASWGTRTGFYTEEFLEQGFRAPEDIRKANLRGVDLRGARIAQADFYLVDLRGARYTSDQERHLRSCGALL